MRKGWAQRTIRLLLLLLAGLFTMGVDCDPPDLTSLTQKPQDVSPSWDTECDGISNATETNGANSYLNLYPNSPNMDPSIARGSPCSGWLENGLNLVNTGTGYFHYNPERVDRDDWGALSLINVIEGAGRDWYEGYYDPPRMSIGDMSKGDQVLQQFGGYFPPHSCHQNGLEVDIRYVRNDLEELPLNIADSAQMQYFDQIKTMRLMYFLYVNGEVDSIFVDGVHSDLDGFYPFIVHKSGHSDHFHVRILDPDGTGN